MRLYKYPEFFLLAELLTEIDRRKERINPLLRVDSNNSIYFYKVIGDRVERIQLLKEDSILFQTRTKGKFDYHYEFDQKRVF